MRYLLIALLVACNPVKKVIKSPDKTQAVVDAYAQTVLFKTDTVTIYLPGVAQVYYDTVQTEKLKVITRIKEQRDTIVRTIRDNTFLMSLQRSNIAKDSEIRLLKEQVQTIGKRADKLNHRLIALWIGIGLLVTLRILKALRLIL